MTDRATLEALLARVLEGEGPDRELDAEIVAAFTRGVVGLGDETPDENWRNRLCRWEPPRVWADSWLPVPKYTESLDAALTLVPEGWGWTVFDADPVRRNPPGAFLVDNTYSPPDDPFEYDRPVVEASAATPPRALIAACIKARMEAQPLSNP